VVSVDVAWTTSPIAWIILNLLCDQVYCVYCLFVLLFLSNKEQCTVYKPVVYEMYVFSLFLSDSNRECSCSLECVIDYFVKIPFITYCVT
jgi:hypothetical protein